MPKVLRNAWLSEQTELHSGQIALLTVSPRLLPALPMPHASRYLPCFVFLWNINPARGGKVEEGQKHSAMGALTLLKV